MIKIIKNSLKLYVIIAISVICIAAIGLSAWFYQNVNKQASAANIGCDTVPAGMTPVNIAGANTFLINQSATLTLADNTLYCNGGNLI